MNIILCILSTYTCVLYKGIHLYMHDFQKEREDRCQAAGERESQIKDLSTARQEISEMKSKLVVADKEVAELKPVSGDLREEIAVKVTQVKQCQKQEETYKQQLEQTFVFQPQNNARLSIYLYRTVSPPYHLTVSPPGTVSKEVILIFIDFKHMTEDLREGIAGNVMEGSCVLIALLIPSSKSFKKV